MTYAHCEGWPDRTTHSFRDLEMSCGHYNTSRGLRRLCGACCDAWLKDEPGPAHREPVTAQPQGWSDRDERGQKALDFIERRDDRQAQARPEVQVSPEPMRYGDHSAVLHVSRRAHTNGEPETRELAEIGWAMRKARAWTRQHPGDKCKVLWGGREVYVRDGAVYRTAGAFR